MNASWEVLLKSVDVILIAHAHPQSLLWDLILRMFVRIRMLFAYKNSDSFQLWKTSDTSDSIQLLINLFSPFYERYMHMIVLKENVFVLLNVFVHLQRRFQQKNAKCQLDINFFCVQQVSTLTKVLQHHLQ